MSPKMLDETDRKIINELKKNSRISMTELGKKVFMTSQAAKNRLERLQELGVVERYTVNLNCPVFDYVTHRLFIMHTNQGKADDFIHFVHETEFHILHCYRVQENTFFIDAHFKGEEGVKDFAEAIKPYGHIHIHPVMEEIRHVHPVDE
ncbi:Lrp/AsnC family transcriptional regulator [Dialister sp.]|uniref:Lrp/AsnC family transcriptional regulator n=1 Tax=Dialister sp. TaxID=1955814 RepID=UPI002E80255E|nr:Lrp/AsnC family transcriptional regulator [Dialister sp.]MEE3452937.1 Lrp/AsnC family transcriptional regulator [Dialister sp.]